ncbi:MAG: RodZ domain-containing protein [Betaproteobacteria bacterium]
MTASNDAIAPDNAAGNAPSAVTASVGSILRAAREKLGLSANDVATKLRMGLKQVNALENSDYAQLPTGTFLRGFVRNYAKAVSLKPDEVLAVLETTHVAAAPVKASSVVVPNQQNIKVPIPGGDLASPKGRAFVIGIVVLLLLAAVWYWWEYVLPYRAEGGRTRAAATQSIAVPAPATSTDLPAAAPMQPQPGAGTDSSANANVAISRSVISSPAQAPEKAVVAPTPELVARPARQSPTPLPTPPVTTSVTPDTAAARPATVPAGSATLGFTFSGESWVRVTDSTGKTVLSRLFKSGDAEEVIGKAPFSVLIGNAKATRMALNGQEFAIDSYVNPNGSTARLTVK